MKTYLASRDVAPRILKRD